MLYFEVMKKVSEKDRDEAIRLMDIIEMDCVTDEDIKEQEKAQEKLNQLIKKG